MAFDRAHAGFVFLVGIILYSFRSSSLEMRNFLSFLEEIRKKSKIGAQIRLRPYFACPKKNSYFPLPVQLTECDRRHSGFLPENTVEIRAVPESAPPGDLFDRETGQGQQFSG